MYSSDKLRPTSNIQRLASYSLQELLRSELDQTNLRDRIYIAGNMISPSLPRIFIQSTAPQIESRFIGEHGVEGKKTRIYGILFYIFVLDRRQDYTEDLADQVRVVIENNKNYVPTGTYLDGTDLSENGHFIDLKLAGGSATELQTQRSFYVSTVVVDAKWYSML